MVLMARAADAQRIGACWPKFGAYLRPPEGDWRRWTGDNEEGMQGEGPGSRPQVAV